MEVSSEDVDGSHLEHLAPQDPDDPNQLSEMPEVWLIFTKFEFTMKALQHKSTERVTIETSGKFCDENCKPKEIGWLNVQHTKEVLLIKKG